MSATSTATDPESEKKTRVSPGGTSAVSRLGQPQRRLVYQAAEHHVRHCLELPRDALEDMRVIVAVADAPPRRDAVDQLAAVGQDDAAAVRPHDRQRRRCNLHLAVGEPDVREAMFIPLVVHESCRIRVSCNDFKRPRQRKEPGATGAARHFSFFASREPRQSIHRNVGPDKLSEAFDRVSKSHALLRFGDDDPSDDGSTPSQRGKGGQRMADRTQIAAGDQDDRMSPVGRSDPGRCARRRSGAITPPAPSMSSRPSFSGACSRQKAATSSIPIVRPSIRAARWGEIGAVNRQGAIAAIACGVGTCPRLRRIKAGSLAGSSGEKPETTGLMARTFRPADVS